MIVTADYGKGHFDADVAPGAPAAPDSAVEQMQSIHSQYLAEMELCRAVNSFQTYLAELLTMIFEEKPETLKSKKTVTREFCVEHYAADDLISALAEQTVTELTYQSLKDFSVSANSHQAWVEDRSTQTLAREQKIHFCGR